MQGKVAQADALAADVAKAQFYVIALEARLQCTDQCGCGGGVDGLLGTGVFGEAGIASDRGDALPFHEGRHRLASLAGTGTHGNDGKQHCNPEAIHGVDPVGVGSLCRVARGAFVSAGGPA
jgi:hypothetical protein